MTIRYVELFTIQVKAILAGRAEAIRLFAGDGALSIPSDQPIPSVGKTLGYQVGDIIVGKEDFSVDQDGKVRYASTDHVRPDDLRVASDMSRAQSRILLEVVGSRIERLAQMSEADAAAEGVRAEDWIFADGESAESRLEAFHHIWAQRRRQRIEDNMNDFVVVVEFRRIDELPADAEARTMEPFVAK
jgi:hypothetical protein